MFNELDLEEDNMNDKKSKMMGAWLDFKKD